MDSITVDGVLLNILQWNSLQVAEILKDRPSWYRDCRAVDVLNVLSTGNGGTIELLYMQVAANCFRAVCFEM